MTRHLILACAALLAAPLALVTHADACSCAAPEPHMLSPARLTKAPLNAHVRVAVPSYLTGRLALRKHGGGEIAVKRIDSPVRGMAFADLVPEKPLEADTRYEVAFIRPDQHPSTLVFGTFVTGTAADTTAPIAPKLEKTTVNAQRSISFSSCSVNTPWVHIGASGARDPDRNDAQLLHAVWASNARGTIDLNAPPTAYLLEKDGKIKLGKSSLCDPNEFPLPAQGNLTLAIAAVDEAGNRSAVQKINVVVGRPPAEAQP